MRIGLAILAVVLLAGCGSAQKDPFVGTWKWSVETSNRLTFVIAKTSDGYRLTAVGPFKGTWASTALTRNGDELDGSWVGSTNNHGAVVMPGYGEIIHIVWNPKSSVLVYWFKMTKLSISTATPGP